MTYDDMKPSVACRFRRQELRLPPSEVHIVLWDSRPAASANDQLLKAATPTLRLPSTSVSCASVVHTVPVAKPCPTVSTPASNITMSTTLRPLCATVSHVVRSKSGRKSLVVDERIQRAREKFLRDQNGVPGCVIGAVTPDPCSFAHIDDDATKNRKDVDTSFVRVGRSSGGAPRKRNPQLMPSATSAVSGSRQHCLTLPTPRLRGVSSPYDSILPFLHRKNSAGTCKSSSVFSGYVPKSKQTSVVVQSTQQVVTEPSTSVSVLRETQDENRRPKVSFSLPAKLGETSDRDAFLPSLAINQGIISSGEPTGSKSFSPSSNSSRVVEFRSNVDVREVADPRHATHVFCGGLTETALLTDSCQSMASSGNVPVSELAKTAVVTAADDSCQSMESSVDQSSCPATEDVLDTFANGRQDLSAEIDEWLCDEIFASDVFKDNGLCPESVWNESQSSLEINGAHQPPPALCDNTVSDCNSGTQEDALFKCEPVTHFTFDDMISYLYH